jgi:hypothetical protein
MRHFPNLFLPNIFVINQIFKKIKGYREKRVYENFLNNTFIVEFLLKIIVYRVYSPITLTLKSYIFIKDYRHYFIQLIKIPLTYLLSKIYFLFKLFNKGQQHRFKKIIIFFNTFFTAMMHFLELQTFKYIRYFLPTPNEEIKVSLLKNKIIYNFYISFLLFSYLNS